MATTAENTNSEKRSLSFVEQMVEKDLAEGKNGGRIQTRFPPEPNGYLHIGHAKAICMDFGVAENYNGVCNLRFDDTNPSKENNEYVENILNDIKWLGFHWGNVYYASDYFEQLWDFAIWLINKGLAYIDEQTSEEIAKQKGTPTEPGTASPYRDRPIEESLALFHKMNTAEAEEGSMVLRAKLDMGLQGGMLVTNPIPEEYSMPAEVINKAIDEAIDEANRLGIRGKETTPFLLAKVKDLTGGDSLASNIQLVLNNARLAARTAAALAQ